MSHEFSDVGDFHRKFGLAHARYFRPKYLDEGIQWEYVHCSEEARLLDEQTAKFRIKFLLEEVEEFVRAQEQGDLAGAADALVDLVYVALGTAHMMRLPWTHLWNEVHQANMEKERAQSADQSKRGSSLDVVKPPGWQPPDIQGVLDACRLDEEDVE